MLDSEKKRRYLEELEVCVKSMHTWRSCIYGKRKKELVVVFIIVSVKSISQHISIYQSITKKQTNYCGKMWQPGSLHWWLFAELRVYTVGEQVPELTGGFLDPAMDLVQVIAFYLTISRIGHCIFKTCVGDMTAGCEGGAAATFCLSLLKLVSSVHDASAEAKELFPLYLWTTGICFVNYNSLTHLKGS